MAETALKKGMKSRIVVIVSILLLLVFLVILISNWPWYILARLSQRNSFASRQATWVLMRMPLSIIAEGAIEGGFEPICERPDFMNYFFKVTEGKPPLRDLYEMFVMINRKFSYFKVENIGLNKIVRRLNELILLSDDTKTRIEVIKTLEGVLDEFNMNEDLVREIVFMVGQAIGDASHVDGLDEVLRVFNALNSEDVRDAIFQYSPEQHKKWITSIGRFIREEDPAKRWRGIHRLAP